MKEAHGKHTLPVLVTEFGGASNWHDDWDWPAEMRGGMLLTERIGCSSLRLRRSEPGYRTDWHGAGDPVLIIVRRGMLRIELRDGQTRDFGPGDAFVAADLVVQERDDFEVQGHRASVVGDEPLEAIHIKLNREEINYRS